MFKRLSGYRKSSNDSASSRSSTRSPETASRFSPNFYRFETLPAEDANAGYENVAASASKHSISSSQSSASLQRQQSRPQYETVDAEDYKRHNNSASIENSVASLTPASSLSATLAQETAMSENIPKSQNEELGVSLSNLTVQETQEARAPTPSRIASPSSTINEKLSAFYVNKAKVFADEFKWAEALEMLDHAHSYGFEGWEEMRVDFLDRKSSSEWQEVEDALRAMDFTLASDILRPLTSVDDEIPREKNRQIYAYNLAIERRAFQAQAMEYLQHASPHDVTEAEVQAIWRILSVLKSLFEPLANLGMQSGDDIKVESRRDFLMSHISKDSWDKGVTEVDRRRGLVADGVISQVASYDDIIAETLGLARDLGASLINDGKLDSARWVLEVATEALILNGEFGLSPLNDMFLLSYPVNYIKLHLPMNFPYSSVPLQSMDRHYSTCATCRGPARHLLKLLDSVYETDASKSDFSRRHRSSAITYLKMRELRNRTAGIYRDSEQEQHKQELKYRLLEATAHLRASQWSNAEYLLLIWKFDKIIDLPVWEKGMLDLRTAQYWFWRKDGYQNCKVAAGLSEKAVHTFGSITPEPMQLNEAVALTAEIYRHEGISHKSEAYESLLPDGGDTMLYGSIVLQLHTRKCLLGLDAFFDPVTLRPYRSGLKDVKGTAMDLLAAIRSDNEELLTILLDATVVSQLNGNHSAVFEALMLAINTRERIFKLLINAGLSLSSSPDTANLFFGRAMQLFDKTMLGFVLGQNWLPPGNIYLLLLAINIERLDLCQMLLNKHPYNIGDLNADIKITRFQSLFKFEANTFQRTLKRLQLPTNQIPRDNVFCVYDSQTNKNYIYPTRILEYAVLKGDSFLPLVEELLEKGATAPGRLEVGRYYPVGWASALGDPRFINLVNNTVAKFDDRALPDEMVNSNKATLSSSSEATRRSISSVSLATSPEYNI